MTSSLLHAFFRVLDHGHRNGGNCDKKNTFSTVIWKTFVFCRQDLMSNLRRNYSFEPIMFLSDKNINSFVTQWFESDSLIQGIIHS